MAAAAPSARTSRATTRIDAVTRADGSACADGPTCVTAAHACRSERTSAAHVSSGEGVPAYASSERDPARVHGHSGITIRTNACSRVMAGPDATAHIAASTRTADDANGLCAPKASASAIGASTSFARRSAERPSSAAATATHCRPARHHNGCRTSWHALPLGR